MKRCYLLIGANLGDVKANIEKSLILIAKKVGNIVAQSSLYQSEPWGYESTNIFYNICLEVNTHLSPLELLDITQEIELEIGRTSKTKKGYEDRLIDIDVLDYDGYILNSERLTLPHPRLHQRAFVLTPLFEIAPEFVLSSSNITISELIKDCDDKLGVVKCDFQL